MLLLVGIYWDLNLLLMNYKFAGHVFGWKYLFKQLIYHVILLKGMAQDILFSFSQRY